MNLIKSKNYLEGIFSGYDFSTAIKNKSLHSYSVILEECRNGSQISISFPGYKAKVKGQKIIYDYRVDLVKGGLETALSHVNIVVDIFNKVKHGKMSSKHLAEILIDYSKNGDLNLPIIEEALLYYPVKPSTSLLSRARKAHGDKKYNEQGNFYDLTIEELLKLIKWIVIQEDINYPPPKYEGRKMSFYRYLEAIYVACNDLYSLERVIKRTLSHRRPSKWNGVIYP